MTWNSHGIRYGFGPNCRRFVTWNDAWNFQENMCHIFYRVRTFNILHNVLKCTYPVKNVTRIFSCLFDGSLVWFENEIKSDGNPVIFLANAMEIPWFELIQNPCHVPAWRTNKNWMNDVEQSWNLVSIWTKLPSICDIEWHGISMTISVIFFTGSNTFS